MKNLPYPIEITEMPDGKDTTPFNVESKPLTHSSLTLGYRIALEDKVITYCPDTGYCDNAVKLSRKADLLIAECTYKSGQQSSEWPHLNPEEAAKLAVKASAKSLALVHFDAYIYQTLEDRRIAEKQAQGIFNNTFAAMDDMQIEI